MLSGRVEHADTRADLVRLAKERATVYYGLDCVAVTLTNEREETDYENTIVDGYTPTSTLYQAEYTAEIKHHWSKPSVGFAKCYKCGLDNYDRK